MVTGADVVHLARYARMRNAVAIGFPELGGDRRAVARMTLRLLAESDEQERRERSERARRGAVR